ERACPEDRSRSVGEVFAQEKAHLLALPAQAFPCEERVTVSAHKSPYVRFDLNDYSIPHTQVNRTLTLLAGLDTVRIVDGQDVLATHPRSFDRGAQIEAPGHIQALVDHKRAARAHRAQDRLHHAAPSAKALFLRAGSRGAHLGVLTRGLLQLLDSHGAAALEAAIGSALAEDAAHLAAVRHFIDAHAHAAGLRPPLAVALPNDQRVRELSVRSRPLSDYDRLTQETPTHDPTDPTERREP
ncbi:MAG: Mu transposase domain-containing protein, partial [Burkholderiales bacterium]